MKKLILLLMMFAIILIVPAFAVSINTTNMTLFVPFNESSGTNAQDWAGDVFTNFSLKGNAIFNTFNGIKGISFDGNGDYVQSQPWPSNASLYDVAWNGSSSVSVCSIIKVAPKQVSTDSAIGCSGGGCGEAGSNYRLAYKTTGKFGFSINGCSEALTNSAYNASSGTNMLYHICVVFTRKDNSITFYLNGSSVASTGGCNQNAVGYTPSVDIGARSGDTYFLGNISMYRFWMFPLGATDVKNVFTNDLNFTTQTSSITEVEIINNSNPRYKDVVNVTENITSLISLSQCDFYENMSFTHIIQSITGLSAQCSQNYTINLSAGNIVNFSVTVSDILGATNQTSQLVTIASNITDTCTYSGSGDWNVLTTDNCNIATAVAGQSGRKLSITGTGGTFTANALIRGFGAYEFRSTNSKIIFNQGYRTGT